MKIKQLLVYQAVTLGNATKMSFNSPEYDIDFNGTYFTILKGKEHVCVHSSNVPQFTMLELPAVEILQEIKRSKISGKTKEQGAAQC